MGDAVWISMITGTTGVVSGLLGYGVSRGQLNLEGRRVDAESQSDQRTQQRETIAARRDLYLEYLSTVDETWKNLMGPDLGPLDWHEWWSRYSEVDNRVELLGSDSVQSATYPLWSALDRLATRVTQEKPEDVERPVWARRVWAEMGEDVNDKRADVMAAMRIDVGSADTDKRNQHDRQQRGSQEAPTGIEPV
jgi:hypothetical protein